MDERRAAVEKLVISRAFWRGRRVLLTGHTGFKGAWACAMLDALGANVTGFALDPPTQPALFDTARIGARVTDLRGDICDVDALQDAMRDCEADIILHMAAQSLVRASYAAPVETWRVNVMGTLNVLEAARAFAPRVVIVVTTDKVYDQRGARRPFREDDPLGGHDPYSSSKAAAEIATASWRGSYLANAVAVASARAGNVIGGGDHAQDRIFPDAMRAFSSGERLRVRAPQAIRPWQHVLEPLAGYLALAEKAAAQSSFSCAWNFGPGAEHERTVAELLAQASVALGADLPWDKHVGLNPVEAAVLTLDAGKAERELGWRCRLDFADTVGWSVDFYRAVAEGADPAALMDRQVADYLARVEAG